MIIKKKVIELSEEVLKKFEKYVEIMNEIDKKAGRKESWTVKIAIEVCAEIRVSDRLRDLIEN